MSNYYITEAFKQLNLLESEDIAMDASGVEELRSFLDDAAVDPDEEIEIYDLEAEAKEDLKKSYEGKVVLECTVCHSHVFEDKENISIGEDGEVCMDLECPYCMSNEGYYIIGEIAPYNPEEAEDLQADEEDLPEVDIEDAADEIDEDDFEDLDESMKLDSIKHTLLKEDLSSELVPGKIYSAGKAKYKFIKHTDDDFYKFKPMNKSAIDISREEAEASEMAYDGFAYMTDESVYYTFFDDDFEDEDTAHNNEGPWIWDQNEGRWGWTQTGLPSGVKAVQNDHGRTEIKFNNEVVGTRLANSTILLNKPELFSKDQIKAISDWAKATAGSGLVIDDNNNVLYESMKLDGIKELYDNDELRGVEELEGVDELEGVEALHGDKHEDPINEACDKEAIKEGCDKELKEDIEDVSVTTEDETMTMTTKEDGGVVIETIPKEEGEIATESEEEMIVPISDESSEVIDAATDALDSEDELEFDEVKDEMTSDEESVDDFEEFDEESFDNLGESYLKNCYENVTSFKTTNVSANNNKLFIEGLITFDSGNKKKTNFVFEAVKKEDGKYKFEGYNQQISRGKKTFKLNGVANNNKLVCESLNYNYRSKNDLNESVRVYGTVRKK